MNRIILFCLFTLTTINLAAINQCGFEIFVKKYSTNPNLLRIDIFEIDDSKMYKSEYSVFAGVNKLRFREMELNEIVTLHKLLSNISYYRINDRYINYKQEPVFHYEIYLKYGSFEKEIIIYQEEFPLFLKPLIEYVESIERKGNFSTIENSSIKGIQDISFDYMVNPNNDTVRVASRASYLLWKMFLDYKCKQVLETPVTNLYKYEFIISYPFDYKGVRIERILYENDRFILIYKKSEQKNVTIKTCPLVIYERENKVLICNRYSALVHSVY